MKKTLLATILVGVTLAATPAFATDSNTLMIFSFRPGGIQFSPESEIHGVSLVEQPPPARRVAGRTASLALSLPLNDVPHRLVVAFARSRPSCPQRYATNL